MADTMRSCRHPRQTSSNYCDSLPGEIIDNWARRRGTRSEDPIEDILENQIEKGVGLKKRIANKGRERRLGAARVGHDGFACDN